MKFNEKLIKLRKMKGMSQEELGYEINVTRQTISKWELGTTTPEMGSLKEISRVFNINIDILTDDEKELESSNGLGEESNATDYSLSGDNNAGLTDEQLSSSKSSEYTNYNEYNYSNEKPKKKSKVLIIILVVLMIVILLIVGLGLLLNSIFGSLFNSTDENGNNTEESKGFIESFMSIFTKVEEQMSDMVTNFNFGFSNPGIKPGAFVGNIISNIADSNAKNERKIGLVYNGEEIALEEISKIAQDIETFVEYQITYEYDEEGYVNKVIIDELENVMDKTQFNSQFESAGIKSGLSIENTISNIIDSNTKNERQIILVYEGEEIPNDEISKIAQEINKTGEYQSIYEYDDEGYINKIIIEKQKSEMDKTIFNAGFFSPGITSGFHVKLRISEIANSNLQNEEQIKLIFNGVEKITSEEINSAATTVGDFEEYQVVYEYDENGYINVIKIDKI